MRETGRSGFKARLIKELEHRFPGCVVLHLDPNSTHQGIPDMLILFENKWAMLETKGGPNSKRQPNQSFYVNFYDVLSFASFIYPENEEEVLNDLQEAFAPRRRTRLPKRQQRALD